MLILNVLPRQIARQSAQIARERLRAALRQEAVANQHHDGDRADWLLWLAAHGVAEDPRAERGSAFEDDFLLIRAAEAGQGLALVPLEHAQVEIASGRLIQVLDKPWPARFAYYVLTKPEALQRPEVKAFVDWIIAEAQGTT